MRHKILGLKQVKVEDQMKTSQVNIFSLLNTIFGGIIYVVCWVKNITPEVTEQDGNVKCYHKRSKI